MADSGSKKPADTPFKQQRLPAWQPILSPPWVISCFFTVAVVFLPLGSLVIVASQKVVEVEVRYDHLAFETPSGQAKGQLSSAEAFSGLPDNWKNTPLEPWAADPTVAGGGDKYADMPGRLLFRWVTLTIPKDMDPPVYMYYKLDNFYQNHRRYARSRSDIQLSGDPVEASELSDCKPFRWAEENVAEPRKADAVEAQHIYAPCGLIAWSMFNDTFEVYKPNTDEDCTQQVTGCKGVCMTDLGLEDPGQDNWCSKEGIAWDSDKDKKFMAPADAQYRQAESPTWPDMYYWDEAPLCLTPATTNPVAEATVGPCPAPGARGAAVQITEGHQIPHQTDESFMVWMRTASLPTFRKLYRKFEKSDQFEGFKEGDKLYIRIADRFNVKPFDGKKYVLLSTTTWIGGKNYFLGIAYCIVGAVCFVLAFVFLIKMVMNRSS